MNKKFIEELKQQLQKEKANIENGLTKFAKEDKELKGDWDTIYPRQETESGNTDMETAADEVEEYSTLLSLEYSLESNLRDINLALKKIEQGKYGKCEKCEKDIRQERLKVYPAAKFCMKCKIS